MKKFITQSNKETQKLGELLAKEIRNGIVVCLSGNLGSGKTTFTQGLLKGLKIKGPYTSPTFVIMKHYHVTHNTKHGIKKGLRVPCSMFHDIYHIDAYRVGSKDILDLGWKEIISDSKNIIIIEWAERVKKIIPKNAIWIKLKWLDENKREMQIAANKN